MGGGGGSEWVSGSQIEVGKNPVENDTKKFDSCSISRL
jgi:hypothetical protein